MARIYRTLCVFTLLAFLILHAVPETAHAQEVSYSNCTGGDSELSGQNGIVYCEPFEQKDFWIGKGYLKNGSRQKYPADAERFSTVSLETADCVSGNCIRIHVAEEECCGIAVAWPLDEAGLEPENLYFRYYMKLAPNFDPEFCRDGTQSGDGGKFPGLADPRAYPEEQCGNGGNSADGINCWSARSLFKSCTYACESTPAATTRFGTYAYHVNQDGFWGDHALWDGDTNRQTDPTCSVIHNQDANCPTDKIIPCSSGADVLGTCGKEDLGNLVNDQWYSVEMQVQMNVPGQEDGVLRGWVNGELAYEKTNMEWRLPGHDNLHVRVVWLNVHFGGEFVGPCDAAGTDVLMDQMVVSTQPIGPVGSFEPTVRPNPPANLQGEQ